MLNRFAFAIVVAALTVLPVTAQVRTGGSRGPGFGISAGSSGMGVAGTSRFPAHGIGAPARFHRERGQRSLLWSYPYLYPDYDEGYGSPEAQPSQVIVVPASAPVATPAPPAPRESLLIEWQGDHFVRTTMSAKASANAGAAPDYAQKPALPGTAAKRSGAGGKDAGQPPRQLPPAILVFHDGRREEVSEYTIMGGTIYSKADYWTDGSWTKKIQIADLDVPATLRLNQERGLKFVLPAGPNEIVVRP
ncbi:MAG: hypothetical protein ACRD20_14445 [Terriglobales bacterium]